MSDEELLKIAEQKLEDSLTQRPVMDNEEKEQFAIAASLLVIARNSTQKREIMKDPNEPLCRACSVPLYTGAHNPAKHPEIFTGVKPIADDDIHYEGGNRG